MQATASEVGKVTVYKEPAVRVSEPAAKVSPMTPKTALAEVRIAADLVAGTADAISRLQKSVNSGKVNIFLYLPNPMISGLLGTQKQDQNEIDKDELIQVPDVY